MLNIKKHLICSLFFCMALTAYPQDTITLDPVTIYGVQFKNLEKAVEVLAKKFYQNYSVDPYISKMNYYKTIHSNAGYIDFKAAVGFISSGRTRNKEFASPMVMVIDKLSSYPFQSTGEELLEPDAVIARYPAGYANQSGVFEISRIKDNLEFSPLNPKYYKYFTYSYDENDRSKIYFKSNNKVKLKTLPIVAHGYIIFNTKTMEVNTLVFEDFVEYQYVLKVMPKAYDLKISFHFTKSKDQLILSEYSYKRVWNRADVEKSYSDIMPARRNPAKYNLEESFYMRSEMPLDLNNSIELANAADTLLINQHGTQYDTNIIWEILSFESAPYTREKWGEDCWLYDCTDLPLEEIISDLSKNTPFNEQIERYEDFSPTIKEYDLIMEYSGFKDKLPDFIIFIRLHKTYLGIYRQVYERDEL